MLKRLYPDTYVPTISDLKPEYFKRRNIKGIIFDLDNTITAWNSNDVDPATVAYLRKLTTAGLKVCILSNGIEKRVEPVLRKLGLPGVGKARKPFKKAFRKALEILDTKPYETAVVGDQVFTDVLGGNRMGFYTILVKPISERDFAGTKVARVLEKMILYRLKRQ